MDLGGRENLARCSFRWHACHSDSWGQNRSLWIICVHGSRSARAGEGGTATYAFCCSGRSSTAIEHQGPAKGKPISQRVHKFEVCTVIADVPLSVCDFPAVSRQRSRPCILNLGGWCAKEKRQLSFMWYPGRFSYGKRNNFFCFICDHPASTPEEISCQILMGYCSPAALRHHVKP